MIIYFATGNKGKLKEARGVFKEFDIEIESLAIEKYEEDADDIQVIARRESKRIANISNKQVMVDDTAVFFDAFDNFPGHLAKRVFQEMGYEGLLKKVEGKDRGIRFVSCVAFCKPGEDPVSFMGELVAQLTTKVHDLDKEAMIYSRIAQLPDGSIISSLTQDEKNAISHRAKAFRQLGEFLSSSNG